jgi:hypothetical protein
MDHFDSVDTMQVGECLLETLALLVIADERPNPVPSFDNLGSHCATDRPSASGSF